MQLLNRENLIDATDGDLEMEATLYMAFFKTSAEYMAAIKAHDDAHNERQRALHSLKGLALNMGAEALAEICKRAESEDIANDKIEHIYQQTRTEMQAIVDQAE